jgi:transaldolase
LNPLRTLIEHGQSFWLDYIRRGLVTSGELKRMVEDYVLKGVTSNPSIFEKATTASTDDTDNLKVLKRRLSACEITLRSSPISR